MLVTVVSLVSSCAVQNKFSKKSTVSECIDVSSLSTDAGLSIVGGTLANGSSDAERATAGLLIIHDLPDRKYKAGTCTGVIATENAILTAAHCVVPEEGSLRTRVYVSFASTLSNDIAAYSNQSSKVIIHPNYAQSGSISNFDIAIVTLSAPIPEGQLIPYVVTSTDQLETGRSVTAIGYGVTGTEKDDSGVRRKTQTEIVSVIDEVSYPDSPLFYQVRVVDSTGTISGACFGDSGGPGFLDSSALVFGIVQGTNGSVNNNPSSCESGDYNYTLISPYIDWIEESLQAPLNKTSQAIFISKKPTASQASNTQANTAANCIVP